MGVREYRFEGYRLLPAARELWHADVRTTPARLVFDCLAYLVEHRQRAVGRDEMVAAVWGRVDVAEARVSELIVRARRTVGDDGQTQRVIRTVPGFGYRWVAETEVADAQASVAAVDVSTMPSTPATADTPEPAASSSPAHDRAPEPEPMRRARWALPAAAIAVLLIAVTLSLWLVRPHGDTPGPIAVQSGDGSAFVVLPVDIDAAADSTWLRLGGMELIAERLRAGGLPVLASDRVVGALRGPDGADLPVPALRTRLGVDTVISGRLTQAADGWHAVLLAQAANGDVHRIDAVGSDAIRAALEAADRLLERLGRPVPPPANADAALEEVLARARAALLAGDVTAARTVLATVPSDARGDWRIVFTTARTDFFAGDFDAADAAFTRLLDDPVVQADNVASSRVLAARATVAFRSARLEAAERDYLAAAARLEPGQSQAERGTALSGLGITHVRLRRFDAALDDLGRARTAFRAAGDRYGLAQVDANLGLLEGERGRLDRALPHLIDAADRFEAIGAAERRLAVLGTVLDTQTALLRWREALVTSDRQWVQRDSVTDPGFEAMIVSGRATVLLGLGRHDEAAAVLDAWQHEFPDYHGPSAVYLLEQRAALQARRGDAAAVRASVDAALALWPDDPLNQRRAGLVLLAERADAARGVPAQAFDTIRPDTPPADTAPALRVAAAEAASRRGDDALAERLFAAALASADAVDSPAQVALAATAFGHWRLARGEHEAAATLAGRVATWAESDFDCALLQLAVFHATGPRAPWAESLRDVEDLAGQRHVPDALKVPPLQ